MSSETFGYPKPAPKPPTKKKKGRNTKDAKDTGNDTGTE